MKINPWTAGGLAVTLLAIFALAGYGDRLGLDAGTVDGIRAAAASLGAVVMAALGALVKKDSDGDGVPDFLDESEDK